MLHVQPVAPEPLTAQVPANEQPALFQVQRREGAVTVLGLPTKWTLSADLYIYVNSGEDDLAVPAVQLNPILDAIEAALAPDIVTGKTVAPFENVNLYPWLAHLLGLNAPKMDGDLNVLAGTLRDNGIDTKQ